MRLKGRYIPDPVINLDRGNGLVELITESEADKCIKCFDINPRKKYTATERARLMKKNSILTAIALIPTTACLMAAVGYMAYRFEMYVPIALVCFSITTFILVANMKGK